jgi:ABC-type nitrate/sulfonate/bicarbonate transport system permease component
MPMSIDERATVIAPVSEPIDQSPSSPRVSAVRRPIWFDVLVLLTLASLVFLMVEATETVVGPRRGKVVIDLSAWSLPRYVGWSLFRSFAAFGLSLIFTFVYGYIAAKFRRAERFMVPLLDILQSVPVLGFMPSLMLTLIAIFPLSNFGLELASILMIFTGQAWNMTFSFYHSLRTIPGELREVSRIYGFGWWRTFWRLELPYAMIPLVWNAKVSMAGGWFFLTVCEAFRLGDFDFRLPGIGSYMSQANAEGNTRAIVYGIVAMTLTIIFIDQLFWRPIIAWAQKFKVEETAGEEESSVVLDLLRESRLAETLKKMGQRASRLIGGGGERRGTNPTSAGRPKKVWLSERTREGRRLRGVGGVGGLSGPHEPQGGEDGFVVEPFAVADDWVEFGVDDAADYSDTGALKFVGDSDRRDYRHEAEDFADFPAGDSGGGIVPGSDDLSAGAECSGVVRHLAAVRIDFSSDARGPVVYSF